MTDPRRDALLEYLLAIRDLMRLQAWDVQVSDKPAVDEHAVMSIVANPARWTGTIFVGTFFDEEPPEQRHVAVHELVHLIQANLHHFAEDEPWRRPLAPDTAAAIADRILLELEIHADAVARMLAPSMPMPPAWPDPA